MITSLIKIKKFILESSNKMSNSDINKAVKLYTDAVSLIEEDAGSLMDLASEVYINKKEYGSTNSPYKVVKDMDPDFFRATLGKVISQNRLSTENHCRILFSKMRIWLPCFFYFF